MQILLSDGKDLEEVILAALARIAALEGEEPPPPPPPPDPDPDPDPPPPPVPISGIWLNQAEIDALPDSGAAWDNVLSKVGYEAPDLSSQKPGPNAAVMANALAFAKTGEVDYRTAALRLINDAQGTEGGRALEVGRNLAAYVIAADIIGYRDDGFEAWLRGVMAQSFDGMTLAECQEKRANNWGTSAGTSLVAAALYLGDTETLERAATVFRGWLGDRSAYAGFTYGDLSWQADPANPVGVNPAGATKEGHDIDGVIPDDQRRTGGFKWPPPKGNYPWGAMQGVVATAWMLHRAGYPAFEWEDQAVLRAVRWLTDVADNPADGDDIGVPYITDYVYGTDYASGSVDQPGKSGLLFAWPFVG